MGLSVRATDCGNNTEPGADPDDNALFESLEAADLGPHTGPNYLVDLPSERSLRQAPTD